MSVHNYDPYGGGNCEHCGGWDIRIDERRAEYTCGRCGRVLVERLCSNAEDRRNFFDGPDHRRTTMVSEIEEWTGECGSLIFAGGGKRDRQLERTQRMMLSSSKKTLQKNLEAIFKNLYECSNLMDNLSHVVVEDAKCLYMKFDKAIKGTTKKGLRTMEFSLALIYLASKAHGEAKPIRDLAYRGGYGRKANEKKVRKFIRMISEAIPRETGKVSGPKDFVEHFADRLFEKPWTVIRVARDILESEKMKCLAGKRSTTIAAVAIYLASQRLQVEYSGDRDQLSDIALVAAIEPGTLKSALKEVESHGDDVVSVEPCRKRKKYRA